MLKTCKQEKTELYVFYIIVRTAVILQKQNCSCLTNDDTEKILVWTGMQLVSSELRKCYKRIFNISKLFYVKEDTYKSKQHGLS